MRIFIGSEPSQYRAERIMIWSIEQVRDRSRVYEIYLMKDLIGFNRRLWLTGFTNYRFAIPHFAGNQGRAIYNDVDQIYLSDPAELFDRDIGGHGFMSIANGAAGEDRRRHLGHADRLRAHGAAVDHRGRPARPQERADQAGPAVSGLWGPIEPEWNSRDSEYVAGKSKVLHYTALHLQPWRPFPRQFVYQTNPGRPCLAGAGAERRCRRLSAVHGGQAERPLQRPADGAAGGRGAACAQPGAVESGAAG